MSSARCAACTAWMVPHRHQPGPGQVMHAGRGLCEGCYERKWRSGRLADFPAQLRPRAEVMEEWELLRSEGYTKRQAAERLGMTFAAFDRAFHRARKAGDPRAYVPGHRLVVAS